MSRVTLGRSVGRGSIRPGRFVVFPLSVPPLRERHEDVPLLASYFADTARRRLGMHRSNLHKLAKRLGIKS